jgi:hypothetical protein
MKKLGLMSNAIAKIYLNLFVGMGYLKNKVLACFGSWNSRKEVPHTYTSIVLTTYLDEDSRALGMRLSEVGTQSTGQVGQILESSSQDSGKDIMQKNTQQKTLRKTCPTCLKIQKTLKKLGRRPQV